jgi:hypothetical protein
MDPWLERSMIFPDLHNRLIIGLSEVLNPLLQPNYFAISANRVWIETGKTREPDISVYHDDRATENQQPNALSATSLVESGLLMLDAEEEETREEMYLEIRSGDGDRLVTAVEILSLANKSSPAGRAEYQKKQKEYLRGGVNLVEIDLLRGGIHTTFVSKNQLGKHAVCDYHLCITLASGEKCYVTPIRLEDRLPPVYIPLEDTVKPVRVELQPIFDRCYDAMPYARLAKYAEQYPDPPLSAEQRTWAHRILEESRLL